MYVDATGRRMEIVWCFRPGQVMGRVLDLSSMDGWDAPHADEALAAEKKKEILRKVIEYAKKRRIPLEVRESRAK